MWGRAPRHRRDVAAPFVSGCDQHAAARTTDAHGRLAATPTALPVPEQRTYELIRPVVLFAHSPAERARVTGMPRSTLYRQAAAFRKRGRHRPRHRRRWQAPV